MGEIPSNMGARQEVRLLPRPDGGDLYTALSVPAEHQAAQVALFCPPVFEEACRAYPVMRECARRLAARGIAALRFDYFATGDSSGHSDQFSFRSAVADIALVRSWLAERFPGAQVLPVGVRLGCRLMLDALASSAPEDPKPAGVPVLWDPVLDAQGYIFTELRETLARAAVVYEACVATREDIIQETLNSGFCERDGFRLNQINGHPVTADLLRDAGGGESSEWCFAEPVSVLVSVRGGDGTPQRNQLHAMLPQMEFRAVQGTPYWNQQQIYSQTRNQLFTATEQCFERCK